MILTAHSGANKTPPNKPGFFKGMKHVNADAIEVDIRCIKGEYYLTHDNKLFPKLHKLLSLRYAFEFIKEYDFKINCDLKKEGYMRYVMDLAEEMGVEDRIIVTGSACDKEDLEAMRFGDLYVNPEYLPEPRPENVKEMRRILDEMGPRAKGINVSYKKVSDEFIQKCFEENVPISLFTVDDEKLIAKYAAFPAIVNITTRSADAALRILGRELRK